MTKKQMDNKSRGDDAKVVREVADRICAVVDRFATRAEAAKAAGISTDQLWRYMKARSEPAFIPIAKMAETKGVRRILRVAEEMGIELPKEKAADIVEITMKYELNDDWIRKLLDMAK